MRATLVVSLFVLASACTSSTEPVPKYEPLVCDPADADHVAFGVQESAALFGPEADKMYGRRFLIIDGSCRYYAGYGNLGQVRTGVLTPDELDAINAELLTGPWETIDGVHNARVGADAWTDSLWRDGIGGSCFLSCDGPASAELTAMLATAFRWEAQLRERGTPLDGPVQLVLSGGGTTPIDGAVELTGTTEIAVALGDRYYGATIIVSDSLDVAALRALRAALPSPTFSRVQLREGDLYYSALVIDAIPHGNADGRLLPPFPIMDYGPPR